VPAGLVALVASFVLGGGDATDARTSAAIAAAAGPASASIATDAQSGRALLMLAVPILVVGLLLAKRHLLEALLYGILASAVLGVASGLITPSQLLRVEPGAFGATGVVVDGFGRAIGVSVFTLLLMALVGTIQATDLLERLVAFAATRARTAAGAEWWIVGTVSAAVMLTTHSVVAVLMTGPFASKTGARHGLGAYRRANLLDLAVCTWPFLLPWFLPTILASTATRDAAALGMPPVGPLTIGMHNTYAWALVAMVLLMVVTGYGREAAVGARATGE
jgi:Na+/H+ antiporter NhaC